MPEDHKISATVNRKRSGSGKEREIRIGAASVVFLLFSLFHKHHQFVLPFLQNHILNSPLTGAPFSSDLDSQKPRNPESSFKKQLLGLALLRGFQLKSFPSKKECHCCVYCSFSVFFLSAANMAILGEKETTLCDN